MFDRFLHHQDIKIFALFKYIRNCRMIARPTNLSKPPKPWEKSHPYPQISQITHFTAHVSVSRVSKHLSTPLPCRRLGTSSKTLLKRVVYIHGPSGSWLISKQLKKRGSNGLFIPRNQSAELPFFWKFELSMSRRFQKYILLPYLDQNIPNNVKKTWNKHSNLNDLWFEFSYWPKHQTCP